VFLTSHYDGAIGELSSVYPSLRAIGCTILLGLRDIYDFEQDIDEWKAEFYNILDRYIDKVLVFGSSRTCKFLPIPYMPKRHQSSIAFVGYIPPTPLTTRALRAGSATRKLLEDIPSVIRVLCQSGGGFDGEDVITKCIDAVRWLVLNRGANVELDISLGPFMKREHKARILAKSNYPFIRTGNFLIRDPEHLLTYSIEIAMAGYNTCVEASYYGLPTVLIPRDYPDDKEQMNRAYFFAPNFSNISVFPSFMHSTAPEQLGELLAAKFNGPIDTHHSREDVPFADTETLLDAILES
jgi:predicted glycosyltransferase